VLAVVTLCARQLLHHREVIDALSEIEIPELVRAVLRNCLAMESPESRPANAALLLAELGKAVPTAVTRKAPGYIIKLTQSVVRAIELDLGYTNDREVRAFVLAELTDARVELQDQSSDQSRPDQLACFFLFGSVYSFRAVWNDSERAMLTLVSCMRLPPNVMEERRENGMEPLYGFCFGGVQSGDAISAVEALTTLSAEFATQRRALHAERQKLALYSTWQNLLAAKSTLEARRRLTTRYVDARVAAGNLHVKLAGSADLSDWLAKEVRIEVDNKVTFYGAVTGGDDGVLELTPQTRNRVDPDAVPPSGLVAVDTSRSDKSIDRQRTALEQVRAGASANARLGALIAEPGTLRVPVSVPLQFFNQMLDTDKQEALQVACSQPDVMIVQGPPGTGKTTFITELVLQTLKTDPGARVLLASQTHSALDNSLERIVRDGGDVIRPLRIASEADKVSPSVHHLLVDERLAVLKEEALERGRVFMRERAAAHHIDIEAAHTALAVERLARTRESILGIQSRVREIEAQLLQFDTLQADQDDEQRVQRADLEFERGELIRDVASLEKNVKDCVTGLRQRETDKELVGHLAEASPYDLRSWAESYLANTPEKGSFKKLLALHADWEMRFGRNREFKAALVAASNVVAGTCIGVMSVPGITELVYDLCIVDEASIATPTEVLVPLSRCRRAVLVGDSRQLSPFQDPDLAAEGLLEKFQLTPADQRHTLFNHLADQLPQELVKSLRVQHRMTEPVGNLISVCFYDGELSTERVEKPDFLSSVLKRRVVWRSTSRLPNRRSKQVGTSYVSEAEVAEIVRLLDRIVEALRRQGLKCEVAVLTGYNAQRERLSAAIEPRLAAWPEISIRISSIDAFQGREADVVLFSVARSDERGLGFLREMERINVALSRGREYVVIVGDALFCRTAPGHPNPLKDVLDYIQNNPDKASLEGLTP
jgi:hypothetical protein